MARRLTLPTLAVSALALLAAAPAASADVLSGSSDDPADARNVDNADVPAATRDIEQVRSTYDGAAGTWSLTVRFREAPRAEDVAQIHARLYEERSGGCPVADGAAQLAGLDGRTSPASAAQRWSVMTPGEVAEYGNDNGKTTSTDGREVTLTATSAKLAGRAAYCIDTTVTHNGVLDRTDAPVVLRAPGEPVPPPPTDTPGDTPGGTPGQPDVKPLELSLVRASRLKAGTVKVTLGALERATTGATKLQVRARHGWRTVAKRAFTATAGQRTTVRLRPHGLGKARRFAARLVVSADGAKTRRFAFTLRR